MRRLLSYEEFKRVFIDAPWGYYPVWAAVVDVSTLHIDLICEYRVHDGKVMLLQVMFETEEQFTEVVAWMTKGANALRDAVLTNVSQMIAQRRNQT